MRYPYNPATALLHTARQWVAANVRSGVECPCCGQHAKVYKRKLHSSMAFVLVQVYLRGRRFGWGYFHVPSYLAELDFRGRMLAAVRGDWAKLKHWQLIKGKAGPHGGQGRTSGIWCITQEGREFVQGLRRVPKYVVLYNERCLGFAGSDIGVTDALGDKFSYSELMGA